MLQFAFDSSGRAALNSMNDNIALGVRGPDHLSWAQALPDLVEDLRSLALQCRGLAVVETCPDVTNSLLHAADEYDSAAERMLAELTAVAPG